MEHIGYSGSDPAIVLYMFMLSLIFVIVCDFFERMGGICAVLLSVVFICIAVGDLIIKRGGLGIPLIT